jgi:hypothetical protein
MQRGSLSAGHAPKVPRWHRDLKIISESSDNECYNNQGQVKSQVQMTLRRGVCNPSLPGHSAVRLAMSLGMDPEPRAQGEQGCRTWYGCSPPNHGDTFHTVDSKLCIRLSRRFCFGGGSAVNAGRDGMAVISPIEGSNHELDDGR